MKLFHNGAQVGSDDKMVVSGDLGTESDNTVVVKSIKTCSEAE